VLFSDLVGSTEIAARLDPEEWREIVADYHRAAAQAIERFGGHVAKYLGDGVMAFFGYPQAHDKPAPARQYWEHRQRRRHLCLRPRQPPPHPHRCRPVLRASPAQPAH
jgi:class 3 adenylate cyclase